MNEGHRADSDSLRSQIGPAYRAQELLARLDHFGTRSSSGFISAARL